MSWVDVTKSACEQMFPADLVTFTEEILNGKLHFLCSDHYPNSIYIKCTWNLKTNSFQTLTYLHDFICSCLFDSTGLENGAYVGKFA